MIKKIAIVSNIASVKIHLKITNTSILFDNFVKRYLKHLTYPASSASLRTKALRRMGHMTQSTILPVTSPNVHRF